MTDTTTNVLLLSVGVFLLLLALTIVGEMLRSQVPEGETNPVIETFMQRVHSWWAMVILLSLALISGQTGVVLLFAFASFAALREFLTFAAPLMREALAGLGLDLDEIAALEPEPGLGNGGLGRLAA